MGTPEHIDFLMTSREIWERDYRPHLLEFDAERFGDLEEARKNLAKARRGPLGAFGPHVRLGVDAAEHGRCDHVLQPAHRSRLDP